MLMLCVSTFFLEVSYSTVLLLCVSAVHSCLEEARCGCKQETMYLLCCDCFAEEMLLLFVSAVVAMKKRCVCEKERC
jgi:hypothetical protein